MDDCIDMTTANPYANNSGGENLVPNAPLCQAPASVAMTNNQINVMKPAVSFTGQPSLSSNAMQAFNMMRQHQAQQQQQQQLMDSEDDDDDQTMNSTNSDSVMSGEFDSDDDSYWSDSSFSDDEADDEYIMYAPTAGGSRTHLLRPMSLDQIQALAVATGARKPGQPHYQHRSMMNLSAQQLQQQHPAVQAPASQVPASVPPAKSLSMPDIGTQMLHYQQMTAGQSVVDPSTGKVVTNPSLGAAAVKPDDRLQAILKADTNNPRSVEYRPYTQVQDFFLEVQPQHVAAFDANIIQAVRGKNVAAIQALHQQGKLLQCCNKFGESIVHMACRQSSAEVLECLMTLGKVSIRVCCDSGRTPLHDACWTTDPNFDIILLLLKECPDLLRIQDKRGFTPLSYVPCGQWARWGNFLEEHKDLLAFGEFA